MRPVDRLLLLHKALSPARQTSVVDIGANPINGSPPYALLRRAGLCHVTGFEPDPNAFAALAAAPLANLTILPVAVGAGTSTTLHVSPHSGLTSTLPLADWVGPYLGPYWQRGRDEARALPITTRKLDDIPEVTALDFLKIDIQGGELAVFQNGRSKLATTAMIQTEAALLPCYEGQAGLGAQIAELRAQGFVPYQIAEVNRHRLAYDPTLARGVQTARSQVLDLDVIFLRDPINIALMPLECLKHMTLLADAVLGAYDLVLRCLTELIRRKAVHRDDITTYLAELAKLSPAKPREKASRA